MDKLGSGTLKLAVSQVASLAIAFGTAPIISRLFSPHEFGIAGLIEAIMYWMAAFGCLSYAQAIPLSTCDDETRSLIRLCLIVTAGLMVPVILGCVFGKGIISSLLNEPALSKYIWFIPIWFLLNSLSMVRLYALSREGRFGLQAISNFSSPNVSRALQIALGFFLGGSAGYLLLSSTVGALVSVIIGSTAIGPLLFKRVESPGHSILEVARKHSQFPRIQMWNAVLLVGASSVPIFLMGLWFEVSTVGQYSLARRMLEIPIQVLGASVTQAFYPEAAAEWNRAGTMSGTIGKAIRILSVTCVFPIVVVGMFGSLLFSVFLGARWQEAGIYSQILCPWFIVVAIVGPISAVFLVKKRAGELLMYTLVLLSARPLAIAGGHWLGSPRAAILFMSIIGTGVFLVQLRRCMHVANMSSKQAFRPLFREASWAVLLLLPATAAEYFLHLPVLSLGLVLIGAAVYAVLVYRREPAIGNWIRAFVSR